MKLFSTLFSNQWPYLLPGVQRSVVPAYVLWILWGLFGVHRFYLGKLRSGFAFTLTFGLLGVGWLYDGLTLPRQVAACNRRLASPGQGAAGDPMRGLLAAAAQRGGHLSVTDGVLATGLPFAQVEATLRAMLASGYVDVRNDPHTGVVQYVFPELVPAHPKEPPPA